MRRDDDPGPATRDASQERGELSLHSRVEVRFGFIDRQMVTTAERAFLRDLRGGCNVAAGALATLDGADLTLTVGLFGDGEAQPLTLRGRVGDVDALGRQAAARVLAAREHGTQ